jgi:uncharacterized protein (DUF427 family)
LSGRNTSFAVCEIATTPCICARQYQDFSMTDDPRVQRARALWRHTGTQRPSFATEPGPGQESVWDYPRPPRIAPDGREVVVRVGTLEVARTRRAVRILETASPPTFYLPPQDVDMKRLHAESGSSFCEWKGLASYFGVHADTQQLTAAAWSYPDPQPDFAAIRGYVAFYPSKLECYVAGERVRPQPGGFYGGWVTSELVGPWKGDPGSGSW